MRRRPSYYSKAIGRVGVILFALQVAPVGAAAAGAAVDFNSQIRPIISARCFACHGPDEKSRKAKLRLDVREEAMREREGSIALKPGDLQRSELIRRITAAEDSEDLMPPPKAGHPLTRAEIELLKRWVQEGAPYAEHWAFGKPSRPAVPGITRRSWPRNPVDHFILARLEAERLKPAPPADRSALIRRLALDLTGLPPTPGEVDAFGRDKSRDATAKVVDRLLASPAYGEKWARAWLDIARYADSYGYGQDSLRQNNPWPYRDWVIRAFNENLPLDKFTLAQLAGDLLEHPTEDDLIATAFHRNTMTNVEGGTDDEEWRTAAVKDRANVTAQAWMGLTLGCAQCHTHKFDPISQKEYYQFYAFFNQTEDNDQPDERPTIPFPTAEQRQRQEQLRREIAALEQKLDSDWPEVTRELAAWEANRRAADYWQRAEIGEARSANGTIFTNLGDSLQVVGTNSPEKDVYTLKFDSTLTRVTGLQLDVLPRGSMPGEAPGGDEAGNFVLTEVNLTFRPADTAVPRARFVRLELPGENKILSLAEVQVFAAGGNIATNGQAAQSSDDYEAPARLAIDGNTSGEFERKSTTHTRTEANPWWEVDLGTEQELDAVMIWNRTDGDLESRLAGVRVLALDATRRTVWTSEVKSAPRPSARLPLVERSVAFKRTTATQSQPEHDVTQATDGKADARRGWAIGGGQGGGQAAVFELAEPLPPGTLTLRLAQNFGRQRTIGRLRLSLTTAGSPVIAQPENVAAIVRKPESERSADERKTLTRWFRQHADATAELRAQMASLRKELDGIKPPQVPIMREFAADQRRITRFLNKGNFLDPGEEVTAAVPAAFHPWPGDAPTNRLGLAQWLMSPENPLTARVFANRIWAQLFGRGLVETEEDFGTQGSLPTHPELLDWLAVELREGGWDLKKFIKLIVTSATYQQSARVTPELLAKDPRNLLLARAPRSRLEAELLRDQALALSGLLSPKVGGPSVYPPQPDGLWRVAFDGARSYPTSQGEDRYRRGLYTVWRRTIPYPSMATFDAPSRESCTFRRLPTNTPLQAFVTLNDPVYVEAAQALGRRLVREGGATVTERIRFGLKLVLARPAKSNQIEALARLYESELAHYRGAEAEALKLATEPLGALPEGWSAAEAAAWTVVANVLLNLDGVLTKG